MDELLEMLVSNKLPNITLSLDQVVVYHSRFSKMESENNKLKQQLKEANEVVEFYADITLYDSHKVEWQAQSFKPCLDDKGKRAREYKTKYKIQ